MRTLRILSLVLFCGTLASAQASRTWVSGVGDDANPCSRTAPCKTFAGAISKTAAGGEIDALDPGGFGALTITKAITLDGGGGQVASVLVAGTNGIVVQAGPTDVVTIRNLRINGIAGSGNGGINGIRWLSGKALIVETCDIFGFTTNGIDIAKSDGGQAFIQNVTIQNVGGAAVSVVSTTTNTLVQISDSNFQFNQFGVKAGDFSRITVNNTVASGNSQIGFLAVANAGSTEMNIFNSTAANNLNAGLQTSTANSTIRISGSSLHNNASGGFVVLAGQIKSFGDNVNSNGGSPTAPNLIKQ